MNEKELDKSLNKTVKPGTEQIALNTAQTQANQLLTEQTMNLQAERQVMTSNSERDVELRGAIELGAMNEAQPQPQPQVQVLPPQAAGLRPETQQLLAKYGVNPNITESAKTTSNSSQTRTANNKMQVIPNRQGGETKVTNTTNITNITNNNSRVETKVDMPKQPALPPGPPARLAPVAVGATAGMAAMASHNKFRTFLNNLFAKRDHERQLQEREFRRRDWSIQRMSRKVMERMNSISEKFASKMNPEKIGSTFTSQIKLFLSMVGLTLLPKVWPAIIGGIDKIGKAFDEAKSIFNDTEGGFFTKLTKAVANGASSIAGDIAGSLKGIGTVISNTLAKLIAGENWDPQKPIGLAKAIGNEIVDFFKGEGAHKTESFLQMMENYFKNSWKEIKDYLNVSSEDRAEAIKTVWKEDAGGGLTGSWTDITQFLNNLPKLLAAAVGGHKGIAAFNLSKVKDDAKNKLTQNLEGDEKNFWTGGIGNASGAKKIFEETAKAASSTKVTSASTVYEGLNLLAKAGMDKDLHGTKIEFSHQEIDYLVNRLKHVAPDPDAYVTTVRNAIADASNESNKILEKTTILQEPIKQTYAGVGGPTAQAGMEFAKAAFSSKQAKGKDHEGKITHKHLLKQEKVPGYVMDMKYLPQLVAVLTGKQNWIHRDLGEGGLERLEGIVDDLADSANRQSLSMALDNAVRKDNPNLKSDYRDYHESLKAQNDWDRRYKKEGDEALDAVGVPWVVDKAKEFMGEVDETTAPYRYKFNTHMNQAETSTINFLSGQDGTLDLSKIGDKTVSAFHDAWNGISGATDKVRTVAGKAFNYTFNTAPLGATDYTKPNLPMGRFGISGGSKYMDKNGMINYQSITSNNSGWSVTTESLTQGKPIEVSNSVDVSDLNKGNSTSIEKRRDLIIKWLQSNLGLNEEQAIGVTAVMECESNLDPNSVNQVARNNGAKYPDSGLCQWQGVARVEKGFLKWYDEIGNKIYGIRPENYIWASQFPAEVQLDYLKYELETGRSNLLSKLRSASGFSEAADLFLRGYENGSPSSSGGKIATAADINRDFSGVYWAQNLPSGVTPHMKMSKDRQEKALGIYKLRKGDNIPQNDINYLASINMSNAKANLSGAKSFSSGDSYLTYNNQGSKTEGSVWDDLIGFLDGMFSNTGSISSDYQGSNSSMNYSQAQTEIAQAVPSSDLKMVYTPNSMPTSKIEAVEKSIEIDQEDIKSEDEPSNNPVNYNDNSNYMTDNSQVVNNYNYVSDQSLLSLTVHGRNIDSNHA